MLILLVIWSLSVLTLLLILGVAIVGAWLYSCGQKNETPKITVPRWAVSRNRNGNPPARARDDELPAV